MQVVEVMRFFCSGSDQPVKAGGDDDYGYDNRCHASLPFDYITGVCLLDRDCFGHTGPGVHC
jgi:hypothetical protein